MKVIWKFLLEQQWTLYVKYEAYRKIMRNRPWKIAQKAFFFRFLGKKQLWNYLLSMSKSLCCSCMHVLGVKFLIKLGELFKLDVNPLFYIAPYKSNMFSAQYLWQLMINCFKQWAKGVEINKSSPPPRQVFSKSAFLCISSFVSFQVKYLLHSKYIFSPFVSTKK